MRSTRLLSLALGLTLLATPGCDEDPPGAADSAAAGDTFSPPDFGLGDLRRLPDSSAADAPAPDLPPPDLAPAPDLALPDQAPPDAAQPDLLQPDLLQPDLLQPDASIPPLALQITFPPRAAMLTGSKAITIKGKLNGPISSLDKLVVNGQLVTPSAGGAFSLPMTSKWGLNIITAVSTDKAGRVINRAQSFHWSPAYWKMQPANPAKMAVTKGALARLYPKAIDDGDRKTVNDLATILEKVINGTNLDAQVPSTLVSGKVNMPWPIPDIGYKVIKNGKLKYNPFKVTLKASPGGVYLTGKTSYMELPARVTSPVGISGKVKIYNLSVAGKINISKASGKAVLVSVPSLKVSYSSLKVSFGSGLASKVLAAIVNGVTSLFKNSIIKKFEAEIKKALPGPVKSFVTGFKFSQSFKLPAELGGKAMKIYSALDAIAFDAGGGNLWLGTAVYANKGIADGKRGSISLAGGYTPPSASARALLIGLRQDTLNQVLCAAWYSGALKQDLSKVVLAGLKPGSLPFTIKSLTFDLDAMLPPIMMPTTAGYDFEIGLGDLFAKAAITFPSGGGSVTAELYASGVIGGNVSLGAKNEITIKLATTPSVLELELAKLTVQGASMPSPGVVSKGLKEMVAKVFPTLGPNIIQQFPIPTIDLSALGGSYGIPKGTKLELTNGALSLKSNHLVLVGDLK